MKYIHYGHDKFEPILFNAITNVPMFTKPKGGLWGSRKDSEYGWKECCKDLDIDINLESSFEFSLKPDARLLTIDSCEKLLGLSKFQIKSTFLRNSFLDFEKIAQEYDAIEVLISEDADLYYELYGWDCDSILIMNPDVIDI